MTASEKRSKRSSEIITPDSEEGEPAGTAAAPPPNDAKIPLIASDTGSVKRGAVAALGVNFYDMGRQTGKVVARILKGEKAGEIASSPVKNLELYVNTSAAQKQGVTLSPEFLKSATKVLN